MASKKMQTFITGLSERQIEEFKKGFHMIEENEIRDAQEGAEADRSLLQWGLVDKLKELTERRDNLADHEFKTWIRLNYEIATMESVVYRESVIHNQQYWDAKKLFETQAALDADRINSRQLHR